jgi:hypothetical protein
VVELVCKLLEGQQARTPTSKSSKAASRALERMRMSSSELLKTFKDTTATSLKLQDDLQQLISSIEKVLRPAERSHTQTRGTFFGFGRDQH